MQEQRPYIHSARTNVHLITNHDLELAPPNEFYVDIDDVPSKFHFVDRWSNHNYTSEEGQVVIGQGLIVGLKDNPYNVAPILNAIEGMPPYSQIVDSAIPSYGSGLPGFEHRRWQNLVIADSNSLSNDDYPNDVWPIGIMFTHAFQNIHERGAGNDNCVYVNSVIELPYVSRAFAEDMQLGCVTGAHDGQERALAAGDFLYLGGSNDGNDTRNLAGKFRKALAAEDDPRYTVGQVWELKKNISMRGWLDKIELAFLDHEHAKTFFTDPTTVDYGPYAPGSENNPYKWPGPYVPTGGMGRGINTMTSGESYGVSMRHSYTVVTGTGAETTQAKIFRYYDGGQWIGYCAAGAVTVVNDTDAGRVVTGTITAEGVITLATAAANAADELTITFTAYGQVAGVPVNFFPTDGTGAVNETYGAATGLATIVLKF